MGKIAKTIGQRIRNYRIERGLTQEQLAALSDCHPTYIGQIERGEKNATIESIAKIASALQTPLSLLFEKINDDDAVPAEENIPLQCYELVANKSRAEQEQLMRMLTIVEKYRKMEEA